MHSHDHHHHVPSSHHRAFAWGIILNSLFVLVEIAYGFSANSLALLADAGHNASDVLGLCIAWGAALLARRKATNRFTYGLQSASILAALVNSILLLLAVVAIGWEAVQRFGSPATPTTSTIIIVAAAGIAVNGATALLFYKGSHHDLNIRGAFLHMAADAGISLGVILSGAVIAITGWLWLDPLTSLMISAIIVVSAWQLFKDSTSLVLHAVPASVEIEHVRAFLSGFDGVKEVHDLHVWAMSTADIALSVHLIMPEGHPGDAFIHTVTHALEEQFGIHHATLQIEMGDLETDCHHGCVHD